MEGGSGDLPGSLTYPPESHINCKQWLEKGGSSRMLGWAFSDAMSLNSPHTPVNSVNSVSKLGQDRIVSLGWVDFVYVFSGTITQQKWRQIRTPAHSVVLNSPFVHDVIQFLCFWNACKAFRQWWQRLNHVASASVLQPLAYGKGLGLILSISTVRSDRAALQNWCHKQSISKGIQKDIKCYSSYWIEDWWSNL